MRAGVAVVGRTASAGRGTCWLLARALVRARDYGGSLLMERKTQHVLVVMAVAMSLLLVGVAPAHADDNDDVEAVLDEVDEIIDEVVEDVLNDLDLEDILD